MNKLPLLTILLVPLMLASCNNNAPSNYDASSISTLIEQPADDILLNESYKFLYQDIDMQYFWGIEDDNCILYAVDNNESVRQLAVFPPISEDGYITTKYIVDFGICGDWIIVSVGCYQGSGGYFLGDFVRLKKDGGDLEHFQLTDDDTFVIVDDWIYYNYWTVEYSAEKAYGCYRIRPDGAEKEYMGDKVYSIILYGEDGNIYGEYDTGEKIDNYAITDFIRCEPDGSGTVKLFSGKTLPEFDNSDSMGYRNVVVGDNYITFTVFVHGYSEDDSWRGHTMYTADYRIDKDGGNLTLLSEDYID